MSSGGIPRHSSPQWSGTTAALLPPPHQSICPSHAPFCPHLWTRPRDTWTPLFEAVTHSQPRGSNPLVSGREPWPQTWRCWLSSQPLDTWLHAAPVQAGGPSLMNQTEPHYLQIAETEFWDPQTRYSSPPGCALRSCPWISNRINNPGGGQHSPKTYLTLCREYRNSSHFGYIRPGGLIEMALVPHTPAVPPTVVGLLQIHKTHVHWMDKLKWSS